MTKAKLTAEELKAQLEREKAKQHAQERRAFLKHLKEENELMEEQIKYFQYQLALPKLNAEWESMQAQIKALAEGTELPAPAEESQSEVQKEPEVITEEIGS